MKARIGLALLAALVATVLSLPKAALGQAEYAGTGPGSYVAAGFSVSAFQEDYGQRLIGGITGYLDANLYRRVGIEGEARQLTVNQDEGVRETTYLVGPKISAFSRGMRPYAKLLAGRGEFRFPFGYAHGSYFVAAPGVGLDWRIGHSRFLVRVVDFEYQIWPRFTFGALHPYGVSTGLSWTLYNGPSRYRVR